VRFHTKQLLQENTYGEEEKYHSLTREDQQEFNRVLLVLVAYLY